MPYCAYFCTASFFYDFLIRHINTIQNRAHLPCGCEKMYAVNRELHPPTGVEHCLECHFFNFKKTSLVVASTSLLRVYDISGVGVANGLSLEYVYS